MRYVTLKVPLRLLAIGRSRQCSDTANARIQPLRDALDHAALSGSVSALKQDHHLVSSGDQPVLKRDEFVLEANQLAKIELSERLFIISHDMRRAVAPGRLAVLEFHLEFFIEAVDHIMTDSPEKFVGMRVR